MKQETKINAPILFITGTDTGVGKTFVAVQLVRALSQLGVKVGVMKPVETGCRREQLELIAEDALLLQEAAGSHQSIEEIVPYRFETPVAPVVAAEIAGAKIDTDKLLSLITSQSECNDLVVVEGAGGLLVPIQSGYTFADLAKELGASIIVVVGSRLGAVNAALLTFEVLTKRKLPCVGYIFNDLFNDPAGHVQDPALQSNRTLLVTEASRYGVREVGYLPFYPEPKNDRSEAQNIAQALINYFSCSPTIS